VSREVWEAMETEARKTGVTKTKRRRGRKETRRESRETEKKVEKRKDDGSEESSRRMGNLG